MQTDRATGRFGELVDRGGAVTGRRVALVAPVCVLVVLVACVVVAVPFTGVIVADQSIHGSTTSACTAATAPVVA